MKKSLTISTRFDTQDFDRSITQMQQKLKDLYAPSDAIRMQSQTAGRLNQMGMNVGGPPGSAQERHSIQYRRELANSMKEEFKKQEDRVREILKGEKGIENLRKKEKELTGDLEEQLKIRKKITEEMEKLSSKKEEFYNKDKALNQAADIEESFKERQTAIRKLQIAKAAAALGAVGTAIGVGADIYEQLGRSAFRTKVNTGSAMQGTAGKSIEDMRSPYGQAWMAERQRAISDASSMDKITRRTDIARAAGGTAMMGAGALGMAGSSALTGTILGAPAGVVGMLGSGASMAGGAASLFGNGRMRALSASGILSGAGSAVNESTIGKATGGGFGVGNWLKSQGDQQMKEYNSILAKEFAQNFQKALSAEQQMNPLKELAAKTYDENYSTYLQSQRSMGLNFGTFHGAGGFREKAVNAGFTDQMGMGMSNEILGAGGSTRMARDSVFGLQAQRGMNLTNAGQVMGTLSGGLGSSGASEEALIKIFAKGMELGLDRSDFAEENRKFTQAAAEIISRTGAGGASDTERTANRFGEFIADKTGVGIEAAKGAYEKYQEISSTTTGPRGVMVASAMMRDEKLKALPTLEKQALADMREEDITENNPAALSIANELGISVAELASRKKGTTQFSISRFKGHDEARERLKKAGVNIPNSMEEFQKLTPQQQRDIRTMSTMEQVENQGMTVPQRRSFMQGQIAPEATPMEQEERDRLSKRKLELGTGRDEDRTVRNLAESSRLALDSFQKFHTEMIPTVNSLIQFNAGIKAAAESMKNMSTADQNAFGEAFKKLFGIGNNKSENQSHAGPTSK